MWYSTMLMVTAAVTVIGAAFSLAITNGDIPLLAYVIPALFLIGNGGAAVWLLVIGLVGFGAMVPLQPVAISLSLWMILPALVLMTGERRNWQVSILVVSVVIAMECGVLALQGDEKLGGAMRYTLMQIFCVVLVWLSAYFWKPVTKISWWPAALIVGLLAGGLPQGAMLAFCGSVLVLSLQELQRISDGHRGDKLTVILPAIGFATIVVIPQFSVPNPVFVAWLLSLTIAWLGDYLLNAENEEEEEE
ncbi:hypothetical protein BCT30_04860 [Enterovibrio norvegicus]|uniref:hypothetical protein n=1 Tax=Enterovibrio norvegicus TaxID=188144 RepID=UPI000C8629C9|nr:hypothetical protein [Enterovibrio norvegicus]MCC4800271.1 hypothetical protein [Enterovibrio norvegicus]PMI33506.1 hypothetical protein BCU46_22170 [Enterovibrio norvegicus]PMN44233.1 hypothetical protein BCT30_04860 [Enterovibrio norvegicus]TKF29576.1 hypothetical protein FCV83_20885 [Enterovibrio norvegicus]